MCSSDLAGTRPGAIRVAQAQAEQAAAAEEAAHVALADARALLREPQELLLQVAVARAQVKAAAARRQQATALRSAAEMGVQGLEYLREVVANWSYPVEAPSIPQELQQAPYDLWRAWSAENAAAAVHEGALASLRQLEAQLVMRNYDKFIN